VAYEQLTRSPDHDALSPFATLDGGVRCSRRSLDGSISSSARLEQEGEVHGTWGLQERAASFFVLRY